MPGDIVSKPSNKDTLASEEKSVSFAQSTQVLPFKSLEDLATTASGRFILASDAQHICSWNLATNQVRTLKKLAQPTHILSFAEVLPEVLLICSSPRSPRELTLVDVIQLETGAKLSENSPIPGRHFCFASLGEGPIVSGGPNGTLTLWQLDKTSYKLQEINHVQASQQNPNAIQRLVVSPDKEFFMSCTEPEPHLKRTKVSVWNTSEFVYQTSSTQAKLTLTQDVSDRTLCQFLAPKHIAVKRDLRIKQSPPGVDIWSIENGQPVKSIPGSTFCALPASGTLLIKQANMLQLYESENFNLFATTSTLPGITRVIALPDNSVVAAALSGPSKPLSLQHRVNIDWQATKAYQDIKTRVEQWLPEALANEVMQYLVPGLLANGIFKLQCAQPGNTDNLQGDIACNPRPHTMTTVLS